jgi:hypothetical protein
MMRLLAMLGNSMDNRNKNQSTTLPHKEVDAPFRIGSIEQLPTLAQDESCRIIKQYFDYLEIALNQGNQAIEISQLREMLSEISKFIGSDKSQIQADGYVRMLNRLTHIYSQGLRTQDDKAFTGTAVNFADILNTVSQNYTGYDYSESVGLLLHYMNKLFNYREESWIQVFEHLLSMPDSIRVMQILKTQHLQEIQNWVEEGVDNLFALLDEQLEVIDNIDAEILQLDRELLQHRKTLLTQAKSFGIGVTPLSRIHVKRQIQGLYDKRAQLTTDREAKLELSDLLNDNILEFTCRLTEIRRSTLVQLVWSNPIKN